ncbi:MAG TPA: tryptophan synthase subunit alpha [Solirubrobacteraceae bacterium]|jgi:tryptophan synthase alpha chain|nr:tryptophan synthase subunit alpha [Solirubrobacteraceae bacterium]
MSVAVTGAERIAEAFESARAEGRRAALMPYLMAGYPDLDRSREIARAYVDGGADLIELGIPFSDPLADGPVIHAADVAALAAGVKMEDALGVARQVANEIPVVVMCYVNVILARGLERFADMLLAVGASGLIVPDLPLEEAPATLAALDARGVALVPLVAPTTPDARLAQIGACARGFLYAVSVTGTTGERAANDGALPGILARARAHTDVPVAVGFGIGTPEQATAAAQAGADGVIVGSRLVRAAGEAEAPADEVRALVSAFAAALAA